jgi:hypothetical protein
LKNAADVAKIDCIIRCASGRPQSLDERQCGITPLAAQRIREISRLGSPTQASARRRAEGWQRRRGLVKIRKSLQIFRRTGVYLENVGLRRPSERATGN